MTFDNLLLLFYTLFTRIHRAITSFYTIMDSERNRRFSTGQMKSTPTTSKSEFDPRPHDSDVSSVYDRNRSQERSEVRVINGYTQATEVPENLSTGLNKVGPFFERNMQHPEHSDSAFIRKRSPVTFRHVRTRGFSKRTPKDERPRAYIGVNEGKHRSTRERSLRKQNRSGNNPPISSRRMSCPEKFSNTFPNERFGTSSRTGMPGRKTSLLTQVNHHLGAKTDESSYALPIITESIESLKIEGHCEFTGDERNNETKTSKSSSPRSFNSEKSADQIQLGPLESKVNVVMSSLTARSEGREIPANKNKIIEDALGGEQQDSVVSRSLNSSSRNGEKLFRKQSINIDLVRVSDSEDDLTASSGRGKQPPRRKAAISPQWVVGVRPKSKIYQIDEDVTTAYQEPHSAKNSEHDLNLKVLAFLRSQQPMASPETLKAKTAKKAKPVLPNGSSLREQKKESRVFINTDTCPSTSNLINQDRSWYYQDRNGKCRYLRVPESPVPPIEWVFQHDDTP